MPAFFLLIPIMVIVIIYGSYTEKQNAEFEAKNCPEMLQVDSSYCKPTKGDDQ